MKIEIKCGDDEFLNKLLQKDNPNVGDVISLGDGTSLTLKDRAAELGVGEIILLFFATWAANRLLDATVPRIHKLFRDLGVYDKLKEMGARVFVDGEKVEL